MHLLPIESGVIDEGDQAIDLGQSSGDIVVLSAADSELAMLAAAWQRLAAGDPALPTLRLANYLQLKHNYSVDLFAEQTLTGARLIVLRLLGGRSYWPYGVDRITTLARDAGAKLVVLPGCPKPDPSLLATSTVEFDDAERLWRYLVEGGPANAGTFLQALVALAHDRPLPPPPDPLPAAGILATRTPAHATGRALVVLYRALVQAGDLAPVEAMLDALAARGMTATAVFVTSLRDPDAAALLARTLAETPPDVVLNTTAFAAGFADDRDPFGPGPFDRDAPWLQVILSGQSLDSWASSTAGLPPRDVAMHIALPELDGRIITRAIAFKRDIGRDSLTQLRVLRMEPLPDRVAFVADLAANWVRLRRKSAAERRVAIVLANYPNGEHRIANAVGLDTPASAVAVLGWLRDSGYAIDDAPADADTLVATLLAGPTNAEVTGRLVRARLSLADYAAGFAALPPEVRSAVTARWGDPTSDHFFSDGAFALPVLPLGHVAVAIQPSRGYHLDPKATYHDAALVPPHGYLAFHIWLRQSFGADAIVHLGKHGNLEWLPGKALALSQTCFPEAALGPMPNIYPFIVNDPGEGCQAKRRTAAVVIDHLPPPVTRAETYGPLKALEGWIDEYYEAQRLDRRRADLLAARILDEAEALGLNADLGICPADPPQQKLTRLDAYLCDLKEMQIRGGLHVFGASPAGDAADDVLVAIVRAPRGPADADGSILTALSADLELGFDPRAENLAEPWTGPRPATLEAFGNDPWRTVGDTVERLEKLAREIVAGRLTPLQEWPRTQAVASELTRRIAPALRVSGDRERDGLLRALSGRFVPPGPSGAPTRGRPDVLPTGRNFYALDNRTVPTPAAWEIGKAAAELVVERYFQDHGEWPKAVALSAWGTSNMRTGGDDIAQALALMGARPTWEPSTRRVTGFEILPLAKVGRPRIDVTLKISGFFRDAFPAQIDLIDSVVRAIAARDEPDSENPIATRIRAETARLTEGGMARAAARRHAGFRVFGAAPGTYGAGLGTVVENGLWRDDADLADVFLEFGRFAYGPDSDGEDAAAAFAERIGGIDAVLHNQDNREHDILDSDDYWQFAGGLAVAARALQSRKLPVYHGDTSHPDRPVIRKLDEEIARVVRARAVNPKWIDAMMRHGYRGASELSATVDFLFAFSATADAVGDQHFDAVYGAYIADDRVRAFLNEKSPGALAAIRDRLREAITRGLWSPRSNSVHAMLQPDSETVS
ncbi:MAG: cobaltochelatase subunit CobN [Hyphomicrobiaceae bacterium]